LGSCQGQNPVAGHGVFAPATPQVAYWAYISVDFGWLRVGQIEYAEGEFIDIFGFL